MITNGCTKEEFYAWAIEYTRPCTTCGALFIKGNHKNWDFFWKHREKCRHE